MPWTWPVTIAAPPACEGAPDAGFPAVSDSVYVPLSGPLAVRSRWLKARTQTRAVCTSTMSPTRMRGTSKAYGVPGQEQRKPHDPEEKSTLVSCVDVSCMNISMKPGQGTQGYATHGTTRGRKKAPPLPDIRGKRQGLSPRIVWGKTPTIHMLRYVCSCPMALRLAGVGSRTIA